MSEKNEESPDESILYEVLEYFVRKQEPEITKFKNDSLVLPTTGTIKNGLRYLNNRYSLPESISQQINDTLPWKFAISDKGCMLAILQENIIEIRKSKDEYSSIIGKATAPKDAFPQWRKLVWSPDGLILALASSNGYVSFYNSFGNNIFNISPKSISQSPDILEAGDAIASMIFKKPRVKSETWDYEFIKVSYSGLLKSFCISANGFSENHDFSFGNFYRNGVNSVSYSEKHNLYFVAGNNINQNLTCIASEIGLTCWRTLNSHPYYTLAVSSQDGEILKSQFSIWNLIPVIKNRPQSLIFKSSISPNDQLISCLHTDGTISIWSLPALKMQKQWKLFEQPEYNIVNPLKTIKVKKSLNTLSEFQPVDVGWWSNNALIIARYSGLISVCSVKTLKNLLGSSPEFLYTYPQLSELEETKGFLCLDCEVNTTSTKRNVDSDNKGQSSAELSSDEDEKDEDEPKPTILNYTTNIMRNTLYLITDIEKFQPKRKKSIVFHRKYRLIGIKSTTPEDLYSRKIALEQYEEALSLAKTYNLDLDLVYQTQWRKSVFSINDLQEYLSKVSKRSVVLNECLTRVPETLEATRELLNFGLIGANLETLQAIGIDDDGKFIPAENEEHDDYYKILSSISEIGLNESQKELIRYRKRLLDHLDKLQTYEILLDPSSEFDRKFYQEFRQLSPLENAVKFAKSGNFQGVATMFKYYGKSLIPHWLAIVSYFPETTDPEKYQKLLPEYDYDGSLRLDQLGQLELRPKDWVEDSLFSSILDLESNSDADFIYENKRSLLIYRNTELTMELSQKWYVDRAYEIERESRLVDHSLNLINIGKSHNIPGLESLSFELEVLADLVYKAGHEDLSLTKVEKLNDLEKIKLLMIKSNEKNFINNIKTMLLPYSRRKKLYLNVICTKNLLRDYLIYLSKDDLLLPSIMFEYLKSFDHELLDAIEDVTVLALECIYVCSDEDMYTRAKMIFDDIAAHSNGREDDFQKYKELEKDLKTLKILNKYEVKIPLYIVKECQQNSLNAKSLLVQMNENLSKIFSQPNEKHWSGLLNDMLDIQKLSFECLDIEHCFEISLMARLKSRSKTVIQGCINLIEAKKSSRSHLKVSYERSIDFILQASNDYFNNSKSLTDPDMEFARECLNLVTDEDSRIKEEYDLIQSLQILNEFHIKILPLQVRKTLNKMNLVEDCLNSQKDAYKKKQKLLNLSNYLRIEKKNKKLREGQVLNLIAKKALEMKDYKFCSSNIEQMIKNNFQPAWNIAFDLACCDDFNDLQFRVKCIWFTIHNGPSNTIENSLKRANLLQIQILNADLEMLIPQEVENCDNEEENKEHEISELFNRPQIENKEFVPKIVQTSTELMKTSAQLVTQSTFGLLKNATNWKSKLNFNFIENSRKNIDQMDVAKKNQGPLQNFPCFYETLNENFGISGLDTKYTKYSVDDIPVKLNLCRTLLRISLLSETASYGAEISDINHLLLECAKYTIPEDCSMSLSYLLNLNDSYLMDIVDLFENIPRIELYSQILAYFSAIKLYVKINSESKDVFFYDPIELIRCMSHAKISSDDHYLRKLKEQINLLIRKNKPEKLDRNIMVYNSKENKLETNDVPASKNIYVGSKSKSDQTLVTNDQTFDDGWGDWDEEPNMESDPTTFQAISKQNSGDEFKTYEKPVTNVSDGWDDWDEEQNIEPELETPNITEENEKEKSCDKFVVNEKLASDFNSADGWDDWEDETTEIFFKRKLISGENNTDNLCAKNKVITSGRIDVSNDQDENINMKTETLVVNVDKKENYSDKFVIDEKLVSNINVSDGWGDWDDEATENIKIESATSSSDTFKKNEIKPLLNTNTTNAWGDWNPVKNFKIKDETTDDFEKKLNFKLESNVSKTENSSDWDNWDNNEWPDTNTKDILQNNPNNDSVLSKLDESISAENLHKKFEEEFSKIRTLEEFRKVKHLLFKWPSLKSFSSDNSNNSNLILNMIAKIVNINKNNEEVIFQEIRDLMHEEIIPINILEDFLNKNEELFTAEQFIFIQLCSKNSSMQHRAIDDIKNNYKNMNLNLTIFEEIFFNDLTALFSVSHDLYYKILEEVFVNRTLPEIEDNVKLLIKNLVDQKNIPHAVALLNQLEGIPSSLSTYENCFKLLLRR